MKIKNIHLMGCISFDDILKNSSGKPGKNLSLFPFALTNN